MGRRAMTAALTALMMWFSGKAAQAAEPIPTPQHLDALLLQAQRLTLEQLAAALATPSSGASRARCVWEAAGYVCDQLRWHDAQANTLWQAARARFGADGALQSLTQAQISAPDEALTWTIEAMPLTGAPLRWGELTWRVGGTASPPQAGRAQEATRQDGRWTLRALRWARGTRAARATQAGEGWQLSQTSLSAGVRSGDLHILPSPEGEDPDAGFGGWLAPNLRVSQAHVELEQRLLMRGGRLTLGAHAAPRAWYGLSAGLLSVDEAHHVESLSVGLQWHPELGLRRTVLGSGRRAWDGVTLGARGELGEDAVWALRRQEHGAALRQWRWSALGADISGADHALQLGVSRALWPDALGAQLTRRDEVWGHFGTTRQLDGAGQLRAQLDQRVISEAASQQAISSLVALGWHKSWGARARLFASIAADGALALHMNDTQRGWASETAAQLLPQAEVGARWVGRFEGARHEVRARAHLIAQPFSYSPAPSVPPALPGEQPRARSALWPESALPQRWALTSLQLPQRLIFPARGLVLEVPLSIAWLSAHDGDARSARGLGVVTGLGLRQHAPEASPWLERAQLELVCHGGCDLAQAQGHLDLSLTRWLSAGLTLTNLSPQAAALSWLTGEAPGQLAPWQRTHQLLARAPSAPLTRHQLARLQLRHARHHAQLAAWWPQQLTPAGALASYRYSLDEAGWGVSLMGRWEQDSWALHAGLSW